MRCPECGNLLITDKKWACEVCRTFYNPLAIAGEAEKRLIRKEDERSSLIAPWYQLMLKETHPYGKVRRMIDLVRVQLITIAGVLIREYVSADSSQDKAIDYLHLHLYLLKMDEFRILKDHFV